jgi:hypothetical protein
MARYVQYRFPAATAPNAAPREWADEVEAAAKGLATALISPNHRARRWQTIEHQCDARILATTTTMGKKLVKKTKQLTFKVKVALGIFFRSASRCDTVRD